jgi:hypothetical protein
MELAGRLAQQHARELKGVLRLEGDRANQARTQLQALAQALHNILSTSTTTTTTSSSSSIITTTIATRNAAEEETTDGRGGKPETRSPTEVSRGLGGGACGPGDVKPLVCALSRQAAGPGGAASGSGGEASDPGSPRREGKSIQTRPSTSTTTTTTSSTNDTGRPPRPLSTARHASRTAVVSSPDLLEHVFTFLAGGKVEARRDLGRAALVCRSWREVAVGEELWGRVASDVMPAMRQHISEVGARRCVVERGHCFRDRRAWVGDKWLTDLRLQIEVWDLLDETCLFSAEGSMGLTVPPHALILWGTDRVEVVCPAFSAASRDPVQRRFASIDGYFRRGPGGTVQEGVRFRVYARDEFTGRQALLWSTSEEIQLRCEDVDPDDPMRPHMPEGSQLVAQDEFSPIYSPALPGQALHACVGFYVCPEAGQEGVAEADKMWRLAGGDEDNYGDHPSFFYMRFDEGVTIAQLASLVRGL